LSVSRLNTISVLFFSLPCCHDAAVFSLSQSLSILRCQCCGDAERLPAFIISVDLTLVNVAAMPSRPHATGEAMRSSSAPVTITDCATRDQNSVLTSHTLFSMMDSSKMVLLPELLPQAPHKVQHQARNGAVAADLAKVRSHAALRAAQLVHELSPLPLLALAHPLLAGVNDLAKVRSHAVLHAAQLVHELSPLLLKSSPASRRRPPTSLQRFRAHDSRRLRCSSR
jgi:hypothetical protein